MIFHNVDVVDTLSTEKYAKTSACPPKKSKQLINTLRLKIYAETMPKIPNDFSFLGSSYYRSLKTDR